MNTSTNQVESDVVDICINFENEVPIMASISDNICSPDIIILQHGEIEDSKHTNTTEQRVIESSAAAHDLNS